MTRIRLLAIATTLMFVATMFAQQTVSNPSASAKARERADELPTVEGQLKILTEKLNLTGDQQAKTKPILRELHDASEKIVQDKRLSREDRLEKVRPLRKKAGQKMRAFLNDDQKNKLDQYLQGPHREMHGTLSGNAPPKQ